jgi:hypothetical protein
MNISKKNSSLFRITVFVALALVFTVFRFESLIGQSGLGYRVQAKQLSEEAKQIKALNRIGKELGRATDRLTKISSRELSAHVISTHSRIPQNVLLSRSEDMKQIAPAAIVASITHRSLDETIMAMQAGANAGDVINSLKANMKLAQIAFIAAVRGMNVNSSAAAKVMSDSDGDGIPNLMDDDADNDGIQNGDDKDVDGDSIDNKFDDDVDGDSLNNSIDDDVDGDSIDNSADDDVDGDGDDNSVDKDDDGDNSNDDVDDDDDGDGVSDDMDDDHGGHGNDDPAGDDNGGHGNDDPPGDDNGGHGNDDGGGDDGDDNGGHGGDDGI